MGLWRSIAQSARPAACFVILPLAVGLYSLGAIASGLRGDSAQRVHRWYTGLARRCLRVAGTDLGVHGLEHVEAGRSYVVVSNHESNWDPISIMAAIPELPIRFVVKKQLMQIPIFGAALRATGNVMVDRQRSGADVKRLRTHMSEQPAEISMLFFAEGTRARDGDFRAFKMGAFASALSEGLRILPVATAGTHRIWPSDSAMIRSGPCVVEIGSAIPVEGLAIEDRAALRDQTREAVGKLRARARQRLRDAGVEPGGID